MRKVLIVVAALAALVAIERLMGRVSGEDSIDYRGNRVQLSRKYGSYEDYKDDPDNIAPTETARVQKLVEELPAAAKFPDHEALVRGVFDIKFPGYGAGPFCGQDGPFFLGAVEVPRADPERDRYVVYRKTASGWTLVDDFVAADGLCDVREEGGQLVYSARGGPERLRRKPRFP
jgi:hypothetical protein